MKNSKHRRGYREDEQLKNRNKFPSQYEIDQYWVEKVISSTPNTNVVKEEKVPRTKRMKPIQMHSAKRGKIKKETYTSVLLSRLKSREQIIQKRRRK